MLFPKVEQKCPIFKDQQQYNRCAKNNLSFVVDDSLDTGWSPCGWGRESGGMRKLSQLDVQTALTTRWT